MKLISFLPPQLFVYYIIISLYLSAISEIYRMLFKICLTCLGHAK